MSFITAHHEKPQIRFDGKASSRQVTGQSLRLPGSWMILIWVMENDTPYHYCKCKSWLQPCSSICGVVPSSVGEDCLWDPNAIVVIDDYANALYIVHGLGSPLD